MISRIATQKSGMESPRNATKVTVWSRAEWRRSAEISPAGTAITVAIRNERVASEMVRGNASATIRDTSIRLPSSEVPRSPCSIRPNHLAYCTQTG